MLVRDIMQKNIITVSVNMSVSELPRMLASRHISGAPVVDEGRNIVGVVSLMDLARHDGEQQTPPPYSFTGFYDDPWIDEVELDDLLTRFKQSDKKRTVTVGEIMTPVLYHINEYESLSQLARLLHSCRIHRAIVTNGDDVVGIVTTMDLMRALPALLEPKKEEVVC